MCGLITILSKKDELLTNAYETIFKELLYVSALRGFDSTGICRINYLNEPIVTKDTVPAGSFLFKQRNFAFAFTGKALLGHNRAATKGSRTEEFAHPHNVDNITLIHNGTLFHHKDLADTESDSLAIATAFSTKDPKEVIPTLSGSFALIWYDSKHKSFHWTRNKERPLYLIETKSAYVLVSELEMGRWILTRNKIEIISEKEIAPYEYYSYKIGENISVETLVEKKNYQNNNERKETGFYVATVQENLLKDLLLKLKLQKNSIVKVEYYSVQKNNNSNWSRYDGYIVDFEDSGINIITYSNHNLLEKGIISGRISSISTGYKDDFPSVIITPILPEEEKKRSQNNVTDFPNHIKTLNGIEITKDIRNKLEKHGSCFACRDSISDKEISKSLLIVRTQEIQEKIVYRLYCPTCVSFFSKCDPQWIARETSTK